MSLDRIREFIAYDPETGLFTWIKATNPKGGRNKAGKIAGHRLKSTGRHTVTFMGQAYVGARLAWFFVTGEMPPRDKMVDHRDLDPGNDRFGNLRLATRSQNNTNTAGQRTRQSSRYKGVYPICGGQYRRKWKAMFRGRYIGAFFTEEEASAAYDCTAIAEAGPFAKPNFASEATP